MLERDRSATRKNDYSFTQKQVDHLGRIKVVGNGAVSIDSYNAACLDARDRCLREGGSRWAVRAVVERELGKDLCFDPLVGGGPIEVNRLELAGSGREYVWVAQNNEVRAPRRDEVAAFAEAVQNLLDYQSEYDSRFQENAERLIAMGMERGLRLVCRDPLGEWGGGLVNREVFISALRQLFFFSESDAEAMANGRGYSQHGHYVFGLTNQDGTLLAMFVLAEFDWGFEGTYTMVNQTLPRSETFGAAPLLMLLANALVLARHGNETLLYGEANLKNIKACISAGYEIVPPIFGDQVHQNVVWRDNPIGRLVTADREYGVLPESFKEVKYVDYSLMRARNDKVSAYISPAIGFIQ